MLNLKIRRCLITYVTPPKRHIYEQQSKKRIGSKINKKYDTLITPFERLMASDFIPKKTKTELSRKYKTLNPFKLQKAIDTKIKKILSLV